MGGYPNRNVKEDQPLKAENDLTDRRKDEILSVFFFAITALLAISLISFSFGSSVLRISDGASLETDHLLGPFGAWTARTLYLGMGWGAHLVYLITVAWAIGRMLGTSAVRLPIRVLGIIAVVVGVPGLLHVALDSEGPMGSGAGGILGTWIDARAEGFLGPMGTAIVLAAIAIIGVLLSTDLLLVTTAKACIFLARVMGIGLKTATTGVTSGARILNDGLRKRRNGRFRRKRSLVDKAESERKAARKTRKKHAKVSVKTEKRKVRPTSRGKYQKPPLTLLDQSSGPPHQLTMKEIQETSKYLEETLQEFTIEAKVSDVSRGPTVTRYEMEPAPGIKVSQFQALADDLALALKAHRVRVEAPIPGKGAVGIEVPNAIREEVNLRSLLESKAFKQTKLRLPVVLGRDIEGKPVIEDLTEMPHLLIAGATGSGKTICVKSLIASLLFCAHPDALEFLLIDPKMVELTVFDGIPHLACPVVTDAKKAAVALNWALSEMQRRYEMLARLGIRNIEVYNEKVRDEEIDAESLLTPEERAQGVEPEEPAELSYIVIVIDELADLIMLARAEVENSIARLAQLARAVGIHLVVATQRPSVNVLTGVIKANFPARLSFMVSSKVDSRTILDRMGAERLIGKGDMLYIPPGTTKPVRIQGAYLSDNETSRLVKFLRSQGRSRHRFMVNLDESPPSGTGRPAPGESGGLPHRDELFDQALQVVIETGNASVSMLQRKLKIGYARAGRLIEAMEAEGYVGPYRGSKAREILVDGRP